jgi:hypothetical protein
MTGEHKYYTAIYRVRHDGHEIGQTEQVKGGAAVTAQLLDRRLHKNEEIGTFPSHKAATKAVVDEWQRRNGPQKEAAE